MLEAVQKGAPGQTQASQVEREPHHAERSDLRAAPRAPPTDSTGAMWGGSSSPAVHPHAGYKKWTFSVESLDFGQISEVRLRMLRSILRLLDAASHRFGFIKVAPMGVGRPPLS